MEQKNNGEFEGMVKTIWDDNDRDMHLVDQFAYKDPAGKPWVVPKDKWINGATIPRALWSLVGSPYTGHHRRASVIHDYFVGEGTNPNPTPEGRKLADTMFYFACRCGGCTPRQANVLYIGVRIGTWYNLHRSSQAELFARNPENPRFSQLDKEVWNDFNSALDKVDSRLDKIVFSELELEMDAFLRSKI